MNNNPLLIAVACGLMTATCFLAPLSLGAIGVVLSTFTAMPLFVAALGFGTLYGGVAGIIAAVAVAAFTGIYGALAVGGATLLPALWVGHMVGLSRNDNGIDEWFPVETILFRMALMSAAIVVVGGALSGYSIEIATEQIRELAGQMAEIQASGGGAVMPTEVIDQQAAAMARIIPFAMPTSVLLLLVLNLLIAARFTRRRDWILRPQVNLPEEVGLPALAVLVFGLGIAASFLDGSAGLVAQVLTGAMGAALALVGLATIHFVTRGIQARGALLTIMYLALFIPHDVVRFLALVVAVFIVFVGVAETLLQLRARRAAPPSI